MNSEGKGSGATAGDIYVVDRSNNRVEQFHAKADEEGHRFVRAFGLDVGGAGVNVCTVAASCQAGTASGSAGGMNVPQGIAIDQVTGNVYVTDQGNRRVNVFSAAGSFEGAFGWEVNSTTPLAELQFCTTASGCQAGSSGGGAGQFATLIGYPAVAPNAVPDIAPNAGNVLIADSTNNRVDEFSVSLNVGKEVTGVTFVHGFGWKVNSTTPVEGLQTCTTVSGCQPGSAGGGLGQFTAGGATRVAEDAIGAIYVINRPTAAGQCDAGAKHCHVQKCNLAATVCEEFAPAQLNFTSGIKAGVAASEITVDPGSGDVYVAIPTNSVNPPVYRILRFNSSGTFLETYIFAAGITQNTVFGLDLDRVTGRLYFSSTFSPTAEPNQRVFIVAEPPTVGPIVVTGGSSPLPQFFLRKLEGSVNPNGFKVSKCRFEYGTTTEYGMSQNCVPSAAALGEGTLGKAVTAETEPLDPNTTYHFRLVAENGGPAGLGDDHTFTTGPAPPDGCANAARRAEQGINTILLPACMALEMVSPPQKGGQTAVAPVVSADGERVGFRSLAALAGTPGLLAANGDRYVASRGPNGWITANTAPPVGIVRGWTIFAEPQSFSPDLSRWLRIGSTAQQYQVGVGQAFQGGLGGLFLPLSPLLIPLANGNREVLQPTKFMGASADQSHLFFQGGHDGTGGERTTYFPGDPSGSAKPGAEELNMYVARLDAGQPKLELLSRDSQGKVWGGGCSSRLGGIGPTQSDRRARNGLRNQGAISSDGTRAYISARAAQPQAETDACDPSNKLRILKRLETANGTHIEELFSSECYRSDCSAADGDDIYQGASVDGTKVYFTTTRQLADSDHDESPPGEECSIEAAVEGCDLYLYDTTLPAGHRLIQVSAGGAGDATPGAGADVYNGITGISGDGSHVYFVAQGVLTTDENPAGAEAQLGQPNLYLWSRATESTSFIGTLDLGDERGLWGEEGTWRNQAYPVPATGQDKNGTEVGGKGDILLFESAAELTPEDADGSRLDVYRYDADPPALRCISCAAGAPDAAPFDVAPKGNIDPTAAGTDFAEQARWVSEDGQLVAFTTAEALVPGDVNGAPNQYLWSDGKFARLPGSASLTDPGPFLSHDGSEVAFQTPSRLLPEDGDTSLDVYVARVGGGFPQPPSPPVCTPPSCQSSQSSSSPPAGPNAGSQNPPDPGNVIPKPPCKKGKVRSARPLRQTLETESPQAPQSTRQQQPEGWKVICRSVSILSFFRSFGLAAMFLGMTAVPAVAAPTFGVEVTRDALQYPTVSHSDERVDFTVRVENTGADPTGGTTTLELELPAGKETFAHQVNGGSWVCDKAPASDVQPATVVCTSTESVASAAEFPTLTVITALGADAPDLAIARATAFGGGAPAPASGELAFPIGPAIPFGLTKFRSAILDSEGNDYTQAGGHPTSALGEFAFTRKRALVPETAVPVFPIAHVKQVITDVPRGVVGNALAIPELCSGTDAVALQTCPASSMVGVVRAILSSQGLAPITQPIFAIQHEFGTPAQFAFKDLAGGGGAYTLSARLRPDDGYAVSLDLSPVPEINLIEANATICGLGVRKQGTEYLCREAGEEGSNPIPLFSNATRCQGPPPVAATHINSWEHPETFANASFSNAPLTGCDAVKFEPTMKLEPSNHQADSPSGLDVSLTMPTDGLTSQTGISQANLSRARITFPEGMAINASAGQGLGACSAAQVKLKTNLPIECPSSSKIGSVEVRTPILKETLKGDVYVAKQGDVEGSTIGLYFVFESKKDGILVKLPGKVTPNEKTGQLVATVDESPEAPFSAVSMHFPGGPQATLIAPPKCGSYEIKAELSSWAAKDPSNPTPAEVVTQTTPYNVTTGPNGGPCPSGALEPKLTAGTENPVAAKTSPFVMRLSREDGSQRITGLNLTLPPGLTAYFKNIPYCPDAVLASISPAEGTAQPQIEHPSCPAASQIGTASAGAGAGPNPLFVNTGRVYLAGPYKGAPLSIAVVAPAVAGPLDLGNVVVRAAVQLNPETLQGTVVSDPIPTILHGILLDIRDIRVAINRPGFTLNPTNCEPLSVSGAVRGENGASAPVSNRFQVGHCKDLAFKPSLDLRLFGGTHRGAHPKFRGTLEAAPGQANLGRAAVTIPRSEFLDQAHIRTICTRVQFAANACPKGSIYGHVTATSPLVDYTVEGPVYLRSSNHKLPDLVLDLHGPAFQPVEAIAVGRIDSIKGQIRTTFENVPDVPITKLVLNMQGGKKGLLVNSRNICASANRATLKLAGQNGKTFDSRPLVKNGKCNNQSRKAKRRSHRRARVARASTVR